MPEHTVRRPGRLQRQAQALMLLAILLSMFLVGYVDARKEITLVVDGKPRTVRTLRSTVGTLLEQQGIELEWEDLVEPSVDTKLERKMTVNVRRAVPVTLVVGGTAMEVKTAQPTVGKTLEFWGVTVDNKDRVDPEVDTPVTSGQKITVVKVEEKETKTNVKVPYTVQRRQDGNLELGQTRVVQKGEEGLAERLLHQILEDGKMVHEEIVSEEILQEPVTEIVAVGTMGTISRGGTEYRYSRAIDAVATAYCPTDVGGNRTAIGLKPKRGIVAVDPRVIPLGTKVYVENYGPALAADTGGSIKGNRVDIFVDSHQEAVSWGRRRVRVYVLK
ncbi:MAG: DUF348 domain-containing protein [Syntrophomonadaceae bacterium]|jgi:uncharacterized protein YabE (DUF348 family)|nr:DUF348 domain-containing protein [Syntrophomonadaceae bacterium]